jgi:hypothetical protein
MRPDVAAAAMAVAADTVEVAGVATAAVVDAAVVAEPISAAVVTAAADILLVVVVAAVAHGSLVAGGIPAADERPFLIRAAAGRQQSRARPVAPVPAAIVPQMFATVRIITAQAIRLATIIAQQISAPMPFIMRSPRVRWPARCITIML